MNFIRLILWGLVFSLVGIILFVPLESDSAGDPIIQDPKQYSIYRVLEEFGGGQWTYFNDLIKRESGWDPKAKNPYSSAYGLGQLLNQTWKSVGCIKTGDPYIQIDCTIKYIKARYGNPEKAIAFHNRHNSY